jgi:hypothetical protein
MPPTRQQQKSQTEKPKKSIFKKAILSFFVLFVLIIGGLAIYLFTLDVESYREPIASYILRETGLQVKIESLGVDFSKGLGLKAGGLSVESGDGKRHIFSAESLFLQAKLKPLLKQKFEVKKTSIIRPVISLHLESQSEEQTTGRSEKPLTKDQLHLETIRKSLRDIHLTVDIIEIREANIHLIQPNGQQETAIVSLDLKLQRPEPELINALVENLDLSVNSFHLSGNAGALNVLSSKGIVNADILFDPFSSSDLQRIFKVLPASTQQLINKYPFSGNVKKLSLQANTPIEAIENISALMEQGELNLALGINDFSMNTEGFGIALQTLDMEQKWANGSLDHKIETTYFGGKILLAGNLNMPGENIESPLINSNLQLVNVDPGGLQLKKDWMPKSGKVSGNFKVQGPIKETDKIKLNGTFSIRDLNLNPPQKNPKAQISFTKLDGNAQWDKGVINHDIKGNWLGSDFSIKGVLNLNKSDGAMSPKIDSDFKFTNINPAQIKPLVGSAFFPDQGSISTAFHLSGPLTQIAKIRWKGTVDGQNLVIDTPDGLPKASFPTLKIIGDWGNDQMKYDIKGSALGGEFLTLGAIKLNKASKNSAPEINGQFEIKNIDLKPLKPIVAADWFPAEGMFSTKFKLVGPLTNVDRLKWDGQILVDKMLIVKGQGAEASNIPIPHLEIKGNWANRKLKHNIQASLFGGQAQMIGDLALKKNASGNSSTNIQSKIKLTKLNFKKAILPWEWAPSEGLLSGSINLSGDQGDGKAVMFNGKLAGEKLVFKPEENQRHSIERVDILANSKSNTLTTITMDMKKVRSNQTALKQIKAIINQTPDTITLTRGHIYPANGEVLVKGNYKLPTKSYIFDLQGRNLKLEDFAKEDVVSPLQFDGALHGTIPEKEPATRGLNGKVNFKAGKGRFHKFKLAQGILTLFNPNAITTKSGLTFDYLGGDVQITNGLMSTKNLALDGDQLKVKLVGTADLPTQKMNMQGVAQPMQLLDSAIKNIPVFGKILSGGEEGVIKTKFRVRGTFDNPHVTTDVAGKIFDGLTGN